jgi:hypothetical protein
MLLSIAFLAAQAASTDDYKVHPIYLVPADQDVQQPYVRAIEEEILPSVRNWYLKNAGVTFEYTDLEIVQAEEDYQTMRFGAEPFTAEDEDLSAYPNWWNATTEAIGGLRDNTVVLIFAQGGGPKAVANLTGRWQGKGLMGDWVLTPISGHEAPGTVSTDLATWQVEGGTPMGTVVHEIGHAFGLHHPDNYDPVKSIMREHWEYPEIGLTNWERLILLNSPFFVEDAYDPEGPWLRFENPDVLTQGQEIELSGEGFEVGDRVEFVWVDPEEAHTDTGAFERHSVIAAPLRVESDSISVRIPENMGPGFIRIRQGDLRSNIVPFNVYPPAE